MNEYNLRKLILGSPDLESNEKDHSSLLMSSGRLELLGADLFRFLYLRISLRCQKGTLVESSPS